MIWINGSLDRDRSPGRDVREPRFAAYHDTLNLYFFTGGKSMFSFEPHQLLMCRTLGWTLLDQAGVYQSRWLRAMEAT
jgi:hypothetical protein